MTQYAYYTADVFTSRRFGGNQLAVLPHADGLTGEQMHTIAREFNLSETTFVLPPADARHTRRVRIFTPGGELPFAGHPTIGTAFVLASIGEIPLQGAETRIVFEEGVGPVPVVIRAKDGRPGFCQLTAAKPPEVGPPLPPRAELAAVLGLDEADIVDGQYGPQTVSAGLFFAMIPLRNRDAVRRAQVRMDPWRRSLAGTPGENIMIFAFDPEDPAHHLRARMYGPGVAVPEDPATGSACASLGGYLGARAKEQTGTLRWVVEQGYEMGRPSLLEIEVEKRDGRIDAVRVGGDTVMVCEGRIETAE